MRKETMDFLEAILIGFNWEDSDLKEDDYTVYSFNHSFIDYVDNFVSGFIGYCFENGLKVIENTRPFGGNCYWSLSGHGVGFWDSEETDHFQKLLEVYAKDSYLFEQIELYLNDSNKLSVHGVKGFTDEN